jgi:membrane protease subunit (stomatin/prohibitin family)
MSFLEKLRSELVDIVEWVDDSHRTLVWRFPRYHNQIKNGAKLIVRPGQEAIFVHQGKIADQFGPGTYVLQSRNLPVLSTLAGWPHGFDSPFKAEVYFVATRQVTDLKWGTPNPVMMRDPDFGPIRVRAFGTYTIKAVDARALLTELVGTDSSFESDEISELLRSIVNSEFADLVANASVPVLDLASNYQELSGQLREAVRRRVREVFGLDVPQLYIVNVSLPAEVEQALDARTSMNLVGDLAAYQQYQIGQSMPVAAANPSGGLAGAGVGVGMGMAMARQMVPGTDGQMGGGVPSAAVPPIGPAPAPPAVTWHIVEQGATVGPFAYGQVSEAITAGRIRPETLVWTAGMSGWVAAAQVPQLGQLFAGAVPPAPPPPSAG